MARKNALVAGLFVMAIFAMTLSGCMLPVYHEPGGYSSTWRKRMRESQVDWPEPVKKSEIAGFDLPDTSKVGDFFSSIGNACRPSSWTGTASSTESHR